MSDKYKFLENHIPKDVPLNIVEKVNAIAGFVERDEIQLVHWNIEDEADLKLLKERCPKSWIRIILYYYSKPNTDAYDVFIF